MTGSDMGALLLSFWRPAFFVLAVIFGLVGITFSPGVWIVAVLYLALGLWAHFAIRGYEARISKYSQEREDRLRTSHPTLYEAQEKLSQLVLSLPGNATIGYGISYGGGNSSEYGLNINISPKWGENGPASVGDLSWEDLSRKIPAKIDEFRLVVTLRNAPDNVWRYWTVDGGFSDNSWPKLNKELSR
jgi:hypothetical protein